MTFKKGAYDVFCPVPGHKALGMNVNLKVGSTAKTTAHTSAGSKSTTTTAAKEHGVERRASVREAWVREEHGVESGCSAASESEPRRTGVLRGRST